MSTSWAPSNSLIALLGHVRATLSSSASSGWAHDGSIVAISSSSNTKNPSAEVTHRPALMHSSLSSLTSYAIRRKS
jgi:hypothetical protein